MANRKQRQQRAAAAHRLHIESKLEHKAHRAAAFAWGMYILSISGDRDISELLHPHVLSYLADDLRDIRDFLKETR